MKRLISIFIILIYYLGGYAQQYPIQQNLGSAKTLVAVPSNGGLKANLIVLSFTDTTAANVADYVNHNNGTLVRTGDSLWIRSNGRWVLAGTGSGGGGSDTIYFQSPLKVSNDPYTVFIDNVNSTDSGYLTNGQYNYLAAKVDYLTVSNDSLYYVLIDYLTQTEEYNYLAQVNGSGAALPLTQNYIISAPPVVKSNDTVDVIPDIIFFQDGVRDTITTGEQYVVPPASTNNIRIDAIIINSGVLDTLQGIEDSIYVVPPDLSGSQIVLAYINVFGADSITVTNVSTYQRTALVYIGANGQLETDSTRFFVNRATNTLNSGTFVSNSVNGIAFQGYGGSDIRAVDGSRRWYITADSFITMRSGGNLYMAQLDGQGGFLIGSNGIDRIPSARLAVVDSTKGFLPPVMRGVRMNGIASPATGLMVYNTTDSVPYYFNGVDWVNWGGGGSGDTNFWGRQGNAGTSELTDFIGTTDNVPFYVRVNNDTVAKFGNNTGNVSFFTGNANAPASFATGQSDANGEYSASFGFESKANGTVAFATGSSTEANGEASISTGMDNYSNGNYTASFGKDNAARGDYSTVMGQLNFAKSKHSLVIGRAGDTAGIANNDTSYLFRIGNGYIGEDAIASYSNILTVGYKGMIVGNHTSQLPDSTLHVVGGLKFDLPSKGNGKVLTSDANGAATWQTPGGGSGITRGTTAITSGTSTRVLYDSAGIVGEYAISGTGSVAMTASPTFTGTITSPAATLTSTTTGFLPNRVTTTEMNAIGSPVDGMMVYNTTEKSIYYYNSDWGWESDCLAYRTKFGTEYFNDLLGIQSTASGVTNDGNINIFATGGIATSLVSTTTNRPGVVELSTSASATGRAAIASGIATTTQPMILGGGRLLYEVNVQVPTLSTSGERFQFLAGLTSTNNSSTASNGIVFLYDEGGVTTGSAASANWQVYTAAASSRTFTTTGVAVTAGQWYKLQAIVNAAGTSVDFYIDGTLVRTETATIPTAAVGFTNQIFKSNGTTARTVLVDYIYTKQKYTTAK